MPFFSKIKRKIGEIRRSNERVRRNWLIGCTAVAIIIVIGAWVAYLNVVVPKIAEEEEISEPQMEAEEEVEKDSIFSVFSQGFQITTRSISDTFGGIFKKFSELIFNTKERLKNVREYAPDDLSN